MEKNLPENPHEGHRSRLRKRYLRHGAETFEPHQLLELLLFFSVPRKDTNELAHRLIRRFGSLPAVLNARSSELMAVKGVGEGTAVLLNLVGTLAGKYALPRNTGTVVLSNLAEAGRYASDLLKNVRVEVSYVLCLDAKSKLIREVKLNEGGPTAVEINARTVVEAALLSGAAAIIIAHNHPGGNVLPSRADIDVTRDICIPLMSIGVDVNDHIIVNADDHFSFSAAGLLQQIKKEVSVRLADARPSNMGF